MNFFKRAVISIRNRKGRSILFLLLFTIVFSLILSGFAIQQSAAQEKINARKSLGAEVRLKRDSNKMKQEMMKGNLSFKPISKETVEKIGQLPQVKSSYLSGSARAEESDLTYVKPKSSTTPSLDLPSTGASPKFEVEGTANLSETTDFKNHDSKLIIFAGAVILLLLILLSVKERKSEIGILLALGEGKRNIILQLLMEIMLLAIASFMLSTAFIQSSGQAISTSILSSQISKDNINDDMNNDFGFDDDQETKDTSSVQPVDQISISLNKTIITKTAIIGLILVVIATLIPSAIISRLDPKYLFSQKE